MKNLYPDRTGKKTLQPQKKWKSNPKGTKRLLIWICCILAIIFSGVRDVGKLPSSNDTIRYQASYEDVKSATWGNLVKEFTFFGADYSERDMGYPLFEKITQVFCSDFMFFMFLTAALFIIPFGLLINKYVQSKAGVILCFLIYFALFTNIVNSFMRQAITLGAFLFSHKYVLRKNWKKYYVLIIAAFTIHNSAVVIAPFYFLLKLLAKRKIVFCALVIAPFLMLLSNSILSYFVSGTVYDNYINADAANPVNYIALVFGVSMLTYIYYERLKFVEDYEILVSGVIGSLMLLPLVLLGNSILRISFYYVILLIPLISVIIDNMQMSKSQRLFVYMFSICFFLYIIIKQ